MVQHNVKHKIKLPEGVKKSGGGSKSSKKASSSGIAPKKGQNLKIAPKNARKAHQKKLEKEITKAINAENEELIKQSLSSGRK